MKNIKKNSDCVVLIPIYKNHLSDDEIFSIKISLSNLSKYDINWIAPQGLDLSFYSQNFGEIPAQFFDPNYFKDIAGYNNLLTSPFFYETFQNFEFCLICQPDAIVLKDKLGDWLETPYDYIGAPWPNGYSLKIKSSKIPIPEGIGCTTFVGNGGLSLRRNKACIDLLTDFDDIAEAWRLEGHAEDLYFGFVSSLSDRFVLPSLMTAAKFSHDVDPEYLYKLIGNDVPLGVHAWSKYNRVHWMGIFREMNYV